MSIEFVGSIGPSARLNITEGLVARPGFSKHFTQQNVVSLPNVLPACDYVSLLCVYQWMTVKEVRVGSKESTIGN